MMWMWACSQNVIMCCVLCVGVAQQIQTFFHLRTPWQPISINCTFHISKIFLINIVAVISNVYVVTVNCNC